MQTLLRRMAIFMALLGSGCASAQWTQVNVDVLNGAPVHIKLDTVRQSGPMAIYRQVEEVRNDAPSAPMAGGIAGGNTGGSTWQLVEYDCMQSRVRILSTRVFSMPGATGEELPLAVTRRPMPNTDWRALAEHPGGAAVFMEVCPGFKS